MSDIRSGFEISFPSFVKSALAVDTETTRLTIFQGVVAVLLPGLRGHSKITLKEPPILLNSYRVEYIQHIACPSELLCISF